MTASTRRATPMGSSDSTYPVADPAATCTPASAAQCGHGISTEYSVEIPCPHCAALAGVQVAAGSATGYVESELPIGVARRVEAVIDAWFDSGSMPAAQVGYPYVRGSKDALRFPADFIAEAIDQTRGWFYSLLAVNKLVLGKAPYRHVVCLGHLVDEDGRKMSKSLGNVIDPWDLVTSRGADPLRWWMFSQGSPWTPTRVSAHAIDTAMQKMLVTLWNTTSFFTTYASLNGFSPDDPAVPPAASRSALDRWALSRVASTVAAVTDALDGYEPLDAALALQGLVDDLSNWFVRRSRRRFWRTEPDAPPEDSLGAQATLHHALVAVTVMLAPFCPFVAERLWREVRGEADADAGRDDAADSVHLLTWPAPDPAAHDRGLEEEMVLARRLSSLGRAARGEAGVKVRQPLSRALVYLSPGSPGLLADVIADELNVDEVAVAQEVAAALESGREVTVQLSVGRVDLGPDDVEVRVRAQSGFAVSREGGEVVALDLALDDDLLRRGLVREVVRNLQDLRRARGLDVADRIRLWLTGVDPELFEAIAREVLAVEVSAGQGSGPGVELDVGGEPGVRAWIEKA